MSLEQRTLSQFPRSSSPLPSVSTRLHAPTQSDKLHSTSYMQPRRVVSYPRYPVLPFTPRSHHRANSDKGASTNSEAGDEPGTLNRTASQTHNGLHSLVMIVMPPAAYAKWMCRIQHSAASHLVHGEKEDMLRAGSLSKTPCIPYLYGTRRKRVATKIVQ